MQPATAKPANVGEEGGSRDARHNGCVGRGPWACRPATAEAVRDGGDQIAGSSLQQQRRWLLQLELFRRLAANVRGMGAKAAWRRSRRRRKRRRGRRNKHAAVHLSGERRGILDWEGPHKQLYYWLFQCTFCYPASKALKVWGLLVPLPLNAKTINFLPNTLKWSLLGHHRKATGSVTLPSVYKPSPFVKSFSYYSIVMY